MHKHKQKIKTHTCVQTSCTVNLYRDIINARTFPVIHAAINNEALINYDANQQLVRAQLLPRLERSTGYWSRGYWWSTYSKRSLNSQDSVRKKN
jgi:hypothetical protein